MVSRLGDFAPLILIDVDFVYDDQIVSGEGGDVLAVRAHRRESSLIRAVPRVSGKHGRLPGPPEHAVTPAAGPAFSFEFVAGGEAGGGIDAVVDETRLAPHRFSPHSMHDGEQAETSHVTRGEVGCIFEVRGIVDVIFFLARAIEILKAQRDGEVVAQGVEDVFVSELLEGDAGGVEVPVVIEPARAGIRGTALGREFVLLVVAAANVDARARHHELLKRDVLFGLDEGSLIFEAELLDGLVEIDLCALLHLDGEEKTEDTFSDGCGLADELGVAVFEDDVAAREDHHGVGLVSFEEAAQSFETGGGESFGLGRDVLPFGSGPGPSVLVGEPFGRKDRHRRRRSGWTWCGGLCWKLGDEAANEAHDGGEGRL